jgi:hypothetical protein
MPSLWQRDFLLCETLDPVAHDVDAALVAGVELQHGFLVAVAEQLPREAEDGGRFADAGHAGDNDVGHVAVFGDDLEALDGFFVADYVAQVDGAVLLDPGGFVLGGGIGRIRRGGYQGRSYVVPLVLALRLLLPDEGPAVAIVISLFSSGSLAEMYRVWVQELKIA